MRSRHTVKGHPLWVENLESRRLLSAAQIDYSNFASLTGLVSNGYGTSAKTSDDKLLLTNNVGSEARSVLYDAKVPVDVFTSNFSFTIGAGGSDADGFTFVIDNGSSTDLGHGGVDLAYTGGTFGAKSVALEFNTFNFGSFGTTFAFASGGMLPAERMDASPIDLHSGDTFDVTVTYNGTDLAIAVKDKTTKQTYDASEAIDLATVLGGETAYVGFTAGTGTDHSTQEINSWEFTGTPIAPTITAAAASSPVSPTGTKSHLSVNAESNDGGTLTYKWTEIHKPSGAPVPTFSPNGTSAASTVVAHYFKAGTYIFRCTVTDSQGGTATSDVEVIVKQTATTIRIEPHKAEFVAGSAAKQFTAAVLDQFNNPMSTQPSFTYAIVTGGGSIDPSTGLYTPGDAAGHLEISASGDDLTGIVGALVVVDG
jgi:hypothetical protein